MSVIVALKDAGRLVFAADSQSTDGSEAAYGGEPKIWQDGEILYGLCGSRRLQNTVRHCVRPGEIVGDVTAWLVATYVPALKAAMAEHGGLSKEGDLDGGVVLGIRGRIFRIDISCGVLEIAGDYEAIGSGGTYALGALFATAGDPLARVAQAVAAAIRFDIYCGGTVVVREQEAAA
jgi:ATP-dependent protease HslVU (ClpYQ) peptidase subunit